MYVYGFRDISRTKYLLDVSPDGKLATTPPLILCPADREHKDYV